MSKTHCSCAPALQCCRPLKVRAMGPVIITRVRGNRSLPVPPTRACTALLSTFVPLRLLRNCCMHEQSVQAPLQHRLGASTPRVSCGKLLPELWDLHVLEGPLAAAQHRQS